MRTLYLIGYDICEPRRLRRVYKLLLAYRVAGQKSLFECWLTPAELSRLRQDLLATIEPAEDRVHIFQLDERMHVQCLGVARRAEPGFFMVT